MPAKQSRNPGPVSTCGRSAPGIAGTATWPPVATTTASGAVRDHIVGRNGLVQLHFNGAGEDLVAQVAKERLVLRMQNAGPAQGAAQLAAALEKRDPVPAFGGDAGRLQPGRPAADDHHALGAAGAGCRQLAFLAGAGVDGAVDREALFHCVDAVFAGDAFANPVRLPGLQLARQVGVGQQRPAHGNEIGAPVGQDLLGPHRVVDSADGDHRYVDHLLDRGRGADVEFVAVVGGVDHPGDQPVDHAAADVEGVHPGGHEFGCHPGGFVDRPASGDPFVTGDAQRDRQGVADLGPDCGQGLQNHPHPPARRIAAVLVGAAITLWRKERTQQHVAVRGVQLDAVVSGLDGAPHRGLEQVEHLGQLLLVISVDGRPVR